MLVYGAYLLYRVQNKILTGQLSTGSVHLTGYRQKHAMVERMKLTKNRYDGVIIDTMTKPTVITPCISSGIALAPSTQLAPRGYNIILN